MSWRSSTTTRFRVCCCVHSVLVLLWVTLLVVTNGFVIPSKIIEQRRENTSTSSHTRLFSETTPDTKDASFSSTTPSSSSTTTSSKNAKPETPKQLDAKQLDFVLGYLNKHHGDLLQEFAKAFSVLGSEMAKANAYSGGSFAIHSANVTDITNDEIALAVAIQRRGRKEPEQRTVTFPLDAHPVGARERYYDLQPPIESTTTPLVPVLPIDAMVRKLGRLCWIVQQPDVSGKLIQLAFQLGGAGIGELPENMYVCFVGAPSPYGLLRVLC